MKLVQYGENTYKRSRFINLELNIDSLINNIETNIYFYLIFVLKISLYIFKRENIVKTDH